MKPILTRLFAGIFLLLASQAFSQALITNFVVTQPAASPYPINSHIVVELRVTNFTNIASMQFPITFNQSVMRFDSLNEAVFSNWNVGNYFSAPNSGKIAISWDGFTNGANMPFSFPNNTAIFKLHFTGLANGNNTVNINPAAAPPALDVVRQGQGPIQVNYQSGGAVVPVGTGQASFVGFKVIANTIYIPQGERGCVPVTVNDFVLIQSMQYAIHWDNAVLNYECTRNHTLAGWSNTDFNASIVPAFANNTVIATWAHPSGAGETKGNGARIHDICFKAVGAPGSTSSITIDGNGFSPGTGGAEAYNTVPVDVWTQANHIDGASGISAPVNIVVTPPAPTDVLYLADTISAAPTTVGCVAVKVKNFTSVTSAEFAIGYNPTELTYSSTQFGANPLNLLASNIVHDVNPGVVKFNWANAAGATVPNDAAIFSVCFTVIAPLDTKCVLDFTTTGCPGIRGMGTTKNSLGVPMHFFNGMIRAVPSGPTLVPTPVGCNGGSNGAIELTNPPNTTATNYFWSGPGINGGNQGQEDPTGLTTGAYFVTVTYSGGITATGSTNIFQPDILAESHTVNTVSCFGGSNGAINLTPTGGTTPFTYTWAGPNAYTSTVEDPSGLPVGAYSVTIKDKNNCTFASQPISISGASQINLTTVNVTNVTCTGLSNGSIVITPAGGAGSFTYDWSNDGPETPDNDPKDLTNMPANTYTVTITDANGCTVTATSSIGAPAPLVSNLVSDVDVKCINTATGAATVNITGGTGNMTYCWFAPPNGNCASFEQNPTNLPANVYNLIVTDQNGCTSTHVQSVVIANAPSPITIGNTTTPSPCFDTPSGAIDLAPTGGWGNYTYAWTGGLPPIQDHPSLVQPGTYTVTVTDIGQCTATHSVTVGGSPAITKAEEVQHVTCFGAGNGGIHLHLAGGNQPWMSVEWDNTSLTGEVIGNLDPGAYSATVTDAQGCVKVFPAITVNGAPELIVTNSITESNPTGAIDVTVSGGTPNYTFTWTGPGGFAATTEDISGAGVIAGEYILIIKDSNGCERAFNYEIPEGNVVGNSIVCSTKNACENDGIITLCIPQTAMLHTPLSINWGFGSMQTSSLNPFIENLNAGVYNITITASNGNSVVLPGVQVAQLEKASVQSLSQNPFDEAEDGEIDLDPEVVGPLQYQWGPPINSTSDHITGLDSGLYVVTITNAGSGCTAVREFHLVREYLPFEIVFASSVVTNPACASVPTGSINVTIVGGNAPYEYQWVGPNGYTENIEDIYTLAPGVYNLTATDENGTVTTGTWNLSAQSNLAITNVNELSNHNGWQVSGANMCDGLAVVAIIPGSGSTFIVWSNGVTGPTNSTLCGGAYSVTVTDGLGCSSVWSDEMTSPPAIAMTQESPGVTCHTDCDGLARVFVTGGVEPYDVLWSTTQHDPSVFAGGFSQAVNLCGGEYTVTITDKNEVEQVFTVNVPEPDPIVVTFSSTTPHNFNSCDGDVLAEITGAVQPVTYVWSGSFGHSGDEERAENLCSGEFVEFYITDFNGCTAYATDSVPYPEDGCYRVSPVLTPGEQDGKNDYVIITCIESSLENTVEIYNRWGQLVFETKGYTNNDNDREHNWNGLDKAGAPLSEGVYYYVMSYTDDEGNKHQIKGAINLLR